ncbi:MULTISPECIES: tripartite tricarboxylate transporter substrate binding protein [unclassified Polynucleobacter]|jgi:tripartite-type tricarboxylate transporter receptor subunit TctC|uniref:Bug family tripartite tricarboxylate transporter substrate binding protein n=1 Tax=unclassified Polynucleobacter TaxID=2640945 RepID=UPI001BFE1A8D|nr:MULTISPECIES: tripartite tricarboxylate transporter substrate binding protein [unclassified Polynucleobacter]MBU3633085.1 tripartite tricarboxylate transporter substrate binding protein [Polynucleobacter sp. AP-Feld-500C-C5]QWE07444.1 tripartite tricarboxylate transporter substrate binding protein [Polynucleobacter sp. JS-JIR-5-A7]
MTIFKSLLLISCTLLGFLSSAFAAPETDWPKKPIVAILAFPAGGSTDIFARSVTAPLAEALGQSIVVENKPGAGGMIGLQAASKAVPDGYTIHISALTNQSISSALFKNPPADLQKDFVPVALIGTVPHLIVINPSVPAKNLPELIAYIKSKKGDFNYASQGNGSLSHLESTLFMQRIGATGTHIPYKGSSFALPDLIAGNTLMMFDSVTASLPHIQSGKLRPIAIAAAERSPLMPNVPTLGQDGMKQFDVENFYAVYVPKGTSPAIVAKLEREIRKILTNPDFKARMAAQGIHPEFANSEKLAEITANEANKWGKVVKSANIKVD